MPWQDNSGKGGGRGHVRGPWGQSPRPAGGDNGGGPSKGGGRGGEPPDLDELLKASKQRLKRAFPRGGQGGPMGAGRAPEFNRRTIMLGAAGVSLLWLLSGFYQVGTPELGVVTTFGKFERVSGPGLHWRLPFPFQSVRTENVTGIREELIPTSSAQSGQSGGLMLTGDKNIVDIGLRVQWRLKQEMTAPVGELPAVANFKLKIQEPENLVRTVAEASIREVVGRNELDFVQTDGRAVVVDETRALMQQTLDAQDTGIFIESVNLLKANPPTEEVNQAFLDVIAAAQDREQFINRAREYANKIVPEARGLAQKSLEDAAAYRAQVTADARGQAARFDSIFTEYQKAPEVTRQRMYLETTERVLGPMNKIIIEEGASRGVVPYLPLNELNKKSVQ
jgi:membrane protease subunit HflK